MDDATRQKAESNFPKYYEYFAAVDTTAQGTVSFN